LRYHEDEEDRLQRNDSFQQTGGTLLLSDRGLEGNAGNRVQSANAVEAYVYGRISWGNWTFTPGLRFESIEQKRVDYGANPDDLSGRDPSDISRHPKPGQQTNHSRPPTLRRSPRCTALVETWFEVGFLII